jgi:hypothetical protein
VKDNSTTMKNRFSFSELISLSRSASPAHCMKNCADSDSTAARGMKAWRVVLLAITALLFAGGPAFAGSATWSPAPASGDWNTAGNWLLGGPPNGPADTATFAISTRTAVSISANTQVNGIVFNTGASAFTITSSTPLNLTISGTGITNNSGKTQNFVTAPGAAANQHGFIFFTNSATAGSSTTFTNLGGVVSGSAVGGETNFENTSSAGSATFNNNGGTVSGANGGPTEFENNSTAANGTFNNNGASVSGAFGGFTSFNQFTSGTSTAGNGTFNNNGALVSGANSGQTAFFSGSTAGSGTFINNGSAVSGTQGGGTTFFGSSTAGNGAFTNNASAGNGAFFGAFGGFINFSNTSTAGNGIFTNNGSAVSGNGEGLTAFFDTATAGNSTFTNNGGTVSGARGGVTQFLSSSTAGAATLIANGGTAGGGEGAGGIIFFQDDSTGGTARVEVSGNGSLDLSRHNAPGVTIGSIEGSGNVFLGADNLTVGNNLSKTLSGVIQDGGFAGGTGGSLTKIGTGILTVTNSNTYTGGTVISTGTLIGEHDGVLGTGNVSLTASGATLTLQGGALNNYISDNATISIVNGATANLNFTGASDRVGAIVLNGVNQTAQGTYGSTSSGAAHQSAFFSGTGTLVLGTPTPGILLNISTRLGVGTGNNVLIGGFIITGSSNKQVLLRALGPTLSQFGVTGVLADPTLELHNGSGALLASNDNWKDTQQSAIMATGKAPPNDLESAILSTLAPGNYTAIVRGKNNTTGIGLVEVYDLDQAVDTTLTNISTRGFVNTNQNVMIGGFISGNGAVNVIVRALGPTLTQFGVPNVLANPTLELHDVNGTLLASNDNWKDTQQAEIMATGKAPPNDLESAIITTRPPGNTTAIVRGKNNTTGNALVEVYTLSP